MATLANILTFARTQAQTDSNGLTDTKGIVFGNEALFDFHRRLIKSGVDASQVQEAYQDGTVGTGTYLYPADAIWLKAIELNYQDTSATNYRTATQVDVSNLPGGQSFSWLRANAAANNPYWDDRGDWFEIFPTPTSAHNVTQMMRIFYFKKPTEFTATSDTIAYPPSMDYRILGWRVAANYLKSLGNIEQGSAFLQEYENRVRDYIAFLSRGSQQPLQATTIDLTGFEF